MIKGQKLLVISGHAADYVWRAGGTIAKYVKEGAEVHLVVLSFGVRGESNDIWKNNPGIDEDSVKSMRKAETLKAAEILGVENIEFWDLQDYPIEFNSNHEERMVKKIREVRPDVILTHDKYDYLNPDHNRISEFAFRCSVMSNSHGVRIEGTEATTQMKIYGFEPHQTEMSDFNPDTIIDITDTYEQKVEAMNCFKAQSHLIKYYTDRAFLRGNHARRVSGNKSYKYAESFANFFPSAREEF